MRTEPRPAVEVQQGMVILLPSPTGTLMPALVVRLRYAGTVMAPEVHIDGLVSVSGMVEDLQIECGPDIPIPVLVR